MAIPTIAGSFLLFWLGRVAGNRIVAVRARFVALTFGAAIAIPGLLFVVYYAHLFDGASWFYRFRSLPATELSACGLGFIAGLAQAWLRPAAGPGKLVAPAVVLSLVLVPYAKPVLSPLAFDRPRTQPGDGTVLQSTFSTCGPASAATLLNLLERPASEQELARESFTSRGGTENWYLARALRRRGLDVAFEIQAADSVVVPSPAIAGVVLPGGAGHFIAILDSAGAQVTFVDPLEGKHTVETSDLRQRYRLTGFFMVVRPRTQFSLGRRRQ